jgi:predicted nucleic acid-binding protein
VPEAVSNTSPLLYLHRIEALNWLPELFGQVWTPVAVVLELEAGRQKGYDVPVPDSYNPAQGAGGAGEDWAVGGHAH